MSDNDDLKMRAFNCAVEHHVRSFNEDAAAKLKSMRAKRASYDSIEVHDSAGKLCGRWHCEASDDPARAVNVVDDALEEVCAVVQCFVMVIDMRFQRVRRGEPMSDVEETRALRDLFAYENIDDDLPFGDIAITLGDFMAHMRKCAAHVYGKAGEKRKRAILAVVEDTGPHTWAGLPESNKSYD